MGMTQRTYIVFFLGLFILVLGIATPVKALTLITQEIQTTTQQSYGDPITSHWGNAGMVVQTIATSSFNFSTSTTLSYVNITAKKTAETPSLTVALVDCGTRTLENCHYYLTQYDGFYNLVSVNTGANAVLTSDWVTYTYVSTTTTITINPTHNYKLLSGASPNVGTEVVSYLGNASDGFLTGDCQQNWYNAGTMGNCTEVEDIAFVLAVGAPSYSSVSNLSPTTGSTTASTIINFTWDYVAKSTVAHYFINILDITEGQSYSYTGPVTSNSTGTLVRQIELESGHAYRWGVWLTDATMDMVAQTTAPEQFFTVITGPASTTVLRIYQEFYQASSTTLYYNNQGQLIFPSNATTTTDINSGMKAWAVLGPIGEALCTRLGFSYLCDLQSVINELGSQSASQRDIVIEMPRTFNGTTTFTMLDVDNIVASSSGMIAHIRMIQAYGMWFLWGTSIVFFILRFL